MTVTTYKWTTDRYHRAIEAGVFDDQPVEPLRGELIIVPPEREPHAYYKSEVGDYLRSVLGGRAKVREAHPITLGDNSEPILDLAIVRSLGRLYLEHHPYPEDIFGVIEFSNATLAKDLNEKKTVYAEAGIPEYWVVNLKDRQLHVFKDLREGTYRTTDAVNSGTVTPGSIEEIQLDVRQLLGL